jgi:hypothetical protein
MKDACKTVNKILEEPITKKDEPIIVKPCGTAPGTRKRLNDGYGLEAVAIGLTFVVIWITIFLIWSRGG